jgi:hypothetical protein
VVLGTCVTARWAPPSPRPFSNPWGLSRAFGGPLPGRVREKRFSLEKMAHGRCCEKRCGFFVENYFAQVPRNTQNTSSFIFHAVFHGDRFAGLVVAFFEHLFFIYIYHEIFHFVFHLFFHAF